MIRPRGTSLGRIPNLAAATAAAMLLCLGPLRAPAAPAGAACGNGLLETGESCESCPADCKIEPCAAGKLSPTFDVELSAPTGKLPSAVTVRLSYRSKQLGLPGNASEPSVRQRIESDAQPPVLIANDLGYAVRVVVAKGGGFGTSPLFRIRFDQCAGATAAGIGDLACVVEGCSGASGAIEGCACVLRASPGISSKR